MLPVLILVLSTTSSSRVSTASQEVSLPFFQTPGSNALRVAEGVKNTIAELKKQRFPADLDYKISLDTTLPVTEGIREIVETLLIADSFGPVGGLFIPTKLARDADSDDRGAGISYRYIASSHFSASQINTLSLFGLVLAIGLVVDDAIVVVEAVEHHIEEGMSPRDATLASHE